MMFIKTIISLAAVASLALPLTVAAPHVARADSIPGPPSDPPQPAGDGAGPWKSVQWTLGDWKRKAEFLGIAALAGRVGLDNAQRNMNHYLSNAGSDLNVPPEDMMADLPTFRTAVQTLAQNEATAAFNSIKGKTGSKTFVSKWTGFYATKALSWDWFFAIGGFSYSVAGVVTKTSASGGKLQYKIYIFDRYNWDTGKSVDIGPIHFEDKDLARLHLVGLAKEYAIRGSSEVNDVGSFKPGTKIPEPNVGGRG